MTRSSDQRHYVVVLKHSRVQPEERQSSRAKTLKWYKLIADEFVRDIEAGDCIRLADVE